MIDVRGLRPPLERDMTTFVFGPGNVQLWPDAELVRGVSSQLVQEGLHTYVRSEGELARFPNPTQVAASRTRPSKFAPDSNVYTDVELSAEAAAAFRSAGRACRVVYRQ